MQGRLRAGLALAPTVMVGIAIANSAIHWHSVLPLYALTAVLIITIGLAVLAIRADKNL